MHCNALRNAQAVELRGVGLHGNQDLVVLLYPARQDQLKGGPHIRGCERVRLGKQPLALVERALLHAQIAKPHERIGQRRVDLQGAPVGRFGLLGPPELCEDGSEVELRARHRRRKADRLVEKRDGLEHRVQLVPGHRQTDERLGIGAAQPERAQQKGLGLQGTIHLQARESEVAQGFGILRLQFQCPLQERHGVGRAAVLDQYGAKIAQRFEIVRLRKQRLAIPVRCHLQVLLLTLDAAKVVQGLDQVGHERHGSAVTVSRGLVILRVVESDPEVAVGGSQRRIEFHGAPTMPDGIVELAVLTVHLAKIGLEQSDVVLQMRGPGDEFDRALDVPRLIAHDSQEVQGVRMRGLGGQDLPEQPFRIAQASCALVLRGQIHSALHRDRGLRACGRGRVRRTQGNP